MKRVTLKILFIGSLSLTLVSCRTEDTASANVTSSAIQKEKEMIYTQQLEIDTIEKVNKRLLNEIIAAEPIPDKVSDKANKARQSICSDETYFQAMRNFSQVSSNRLMSLEA